MDTIKFTVEEYVDQVNEFHFPTINIYINQVNLIHLVERVESRYRASLRADQKFSQSYVGLHPQYHRYYHEEFTGRPQRPYSILLTCTCLEELCNSIVAKITMDFGTVTWSEIRSPFLDAGSAYWKELAGEEKIAGYPIDYSTLGPFVFRFDQYVHALSMI